MKLAVGVMLSSFGMFWGAEGAGASWPGGEAALVAIIPGMLATALALAWTARRVASASDRVDGGPTPAEPSEQATVGA